jgi:hypothetical protein
MADYLPQANGLWSTTTWITAFSNLTAFAGGNTPPTFIDDVYADGKTITIDTNVRVLSLRNTTSPRTGGLTGGSFTLNNGINLIANVITGTATVACINYNGTAGNSASLSGNIVGGGTSGAYGASNNSTGTLNISGNVTGGPGSNSHGLHNASSGVVNIIGNAIGGGGSGTYGVRNLLNGVVNITGTAVGGTVGDGVFNAAGGIITINGNVSGGNIAANYGATNSGVGILNISGSITGGTVANAYGAINSANGIINIIGTVTGGSAASTEGVRNNSTGTVNITGSAISGIGSSAFGVNNNSTGQVYCTRVVGNGFGLGSVGINSNVGLANSQNGRAYIEQAEFGPRGQTPISGPVYILPSNRNTLTGVLTALGNTVTFYNSLSVSGLIPPASSVQLGTVYNVGNSVGTMAVPSVSAVEFGVPVDNTVGVAALTPQTVWGYSRLSATDVGSMGDRLRNAATAQSVGSQIASFNL